RAAEGQHLRQAPPLRRSGGFLAQRSQLQQVHQVALAVGAAHQVRLERGEAGRLQLAVRVGRQVGALGGHEAASWVKGSNSDFSCSRARFSRLVTVPMGMARWAAISLYERRSSAWRWNTSRNDDFTRGRTRIRSSTDTRAHA